MAAENTDRPSQMNADSLPVFQRHYSEQIP